MLPHDTLRGLDAFHLRHRDIHQHDVRLCAVVLGDRRAAITRFTSDLAAECFDHPSQVLASKNGVIHHKVADGRFVLTSDQSRKLLHIRYPHIPSRHLRAASSPVRTLISLARARSVRHSACKVLASASSGTTRFAYPRSIAAFGIPNTTHESSLWAIVIPPIDLIAFMPSAPSSP